MLPAPPRDEQDQIVLFLDWKVSEINRLINAKRKEIKILEELKKSMINNAVTRGLDQNVETKPSGVKWLGDIPAHWHLVRNKTIFQETKETVGSNATEYPLLSLTTKGIIFRDVLSGKGKYPKDFNTYKIVQKGDIVFCLFDIDETPRTVGLSEYDGMLTGAYTIFHIRNINNRYVYYYYLSLDNVKALRPLYSGLRKTINTNTFLGIKTPFPPLDEQEDIVRFLDKKVLGINHLIDIKTKEILAFEEMKNSFIADVVTGTIDVRDVEIPAYELVDEDVDMGEADKDFEQDGSEDNEE